MPSFPSILHRGERILLTLWIGGMWFVGYVAAPMLFTVLESRQMAGMVAGHLFTAVHYVGLVCGGLLLLGIFLDRASGKWRRVRVWVLVGMLLIIVLNQFMIHPLLADLKLEGLVEGSAAAIQFGRLHGVSAILYLLCSLLGLLLIWHDFGGKRDG